MTAERVTGLASTLRKMAQAEDAVRRSLAQALYEEGQRVDADGVRRVPVDTGRLRSTHYVAPPVDDVGTITVEIGYGTDYAVPVHERTDVHHPVGEAGYLRKAMDAAARGFSSRVARRTKTLAEAGRGVTPLLPSTGGEDG